MRFLIYVDNYLVITKYISVPIKTVQEYLSDFITHGVIDYEESIFYPGHSIKYIKILD